MPFINDRLQDSQLASTRSATGTSSRAYRFLFDPAKVMALLRSRIVGQPGMMAAMDDMLHLVKAELTPPHRPLAVTLFMGPTGVGKTETVRVLAEGIYGDSEAFCRIDMNTLSQDHYAAALSGAPPGYVGSKEGHTLFQRPLIEGSFGKPGIVLLDELEKAGTDVVRTVLNILDNGRIQLAGGQGELDFRNSLIFMTSNIGAAEIARSPESHAGRIYSRLVQRFFRPTHEHLYKQALHRHFDPEFLNRIDRTVIFDEIPESELDQLLIIEFDKLRFQLKRHQLSLEMDASAFDFIKEHYEQRFGARDIARKLRQYVQVPLARAILEHSNCCHFLVVARQGRILVEAR